MPTFRELWQGFREEWPTWLVSFIIALGLFAWISEIAPQTRETRVIALEVRPSAQVALANSLPTQQELTIVGGPEDVRNYLDSDPKAVLDLTNAVEGIRQEFKLVLEPPPNPLLLQASYEEAVLVDLAPRADARFAPQFEAIGQLQPGLQMESEIADLPGEVRVTGPTRRVGEVVQVIFRVDISSLEGTVPRDVEFIPLDITGGKVPFVQIEPPRATVRLIINREGETIRVPILPRHTGAPAPNFALSSIRAEPQTVEITGPGRDLRRITTLETEPIDLTNIAADQTYRAQVAIPPGATWTVRPERVEVSVRVERVVTSRSLTGVPVLLTEQSPGRTYRLTPPGLQLTVQGDLTTVQNLTLAGIQATLRVADLELGTHEIATDAIAIRLPAGVFVTDRSPDTLTLVVTDPEGADPDPGE